MLSRNGYQNSVSIPDYAYIVLDLNCKNDTTMLYVYTLSIQNEYTYNMSSCN